jgi:hypothetical protein
LLELTKAERKFKATKKTKERVTPASGDKSQKKSVKKKEKKPVKGIASRVKKIFKKERDAL